MLNQIISTIHQSGEFVFVFRSGSYLKSSVGGLFSWGRARGGGGGGYSTKFYTGRLCLRSSPLPFYIHVPFLTEKVPLLLPSIHNNFGTLFTYLV